MTQLAPSLARDRRPVPGSRAFSHQDGRGFIVCGTRAGLKRYRDIAARMPRDFLIAPVDVDPGSVLWPVQGAAGLCVFGCGAPASFTARLVQALLADGAELVVHLKDPERASIHRRNPA